MKHYKDPNTNEIYAYESDGSQDDYIKPELVPITDEEADEIRAANTKSIFDALSYAEKRRIEYPSFGEQFDLLFHGGMDAWKAAIQTVKDKYPKENS